MIKKRKQAGLKQHQILAQAANIARNSVDIVVIIYPSCANCSQYN